MKTKYPLTLTEDRLLLIKEGLTVLDALIRTWPKPDAHWLQEIHEIKADIDFALKDLQSLKNYSTNL